MKQDGGKMKEGSKERKRREGSEKRKGPDRWPGFFLPPRLETGTWGRGRPRFPFLLLTGPCCVRATPSLQLFGGDPS